MERFKNSKREYWYTDESGKWHKAKTNMKKTKWLIVTAIVFNILLNFNPCD